MDILSSRILLRPGGLDRSGRFYRDVLGLAICRESGPPDDPGVVFFPSQGLPAVRIITEPVTEPRGLTGMRIQDPGWHPDRPGRGTPPISLSGGTRDRFHLQDHRHAADAHLHSPNTWASLAG